MTNVLVTGAGGYIGTVLVPSLLRDGHRVRAVDRYFFGRHLLDPHEDLEVVVEDVRRLQSDHYEGIDAVIDLAAISNDPSGEHFEDATWQINHEARARCARLAREGGVSRYILPSTCSVYGFQSAEFIADETSGTNPLTTYAKANLAAENDVLSLADDEFCAVVLRQATVYGLSPRMRFDLAINGMTYGAWKTGRLPLMRNGDQWRPMVHVKDTVAAQMFMLGAEASTIRGEVFNVGSADNVYQIGPLGELVAEEVGKNVVIEWYGDPDDRSYRVAFGKIEALGWKASLDARYGVREVLSALEAGAIDRTTETITLEWYLALHRYREIINEVELYGGLLDIPDSPA